MFSPFYAWSRRKKPADPEQHCSLNVALYGRPKRWAMTERGRTKLTRSDNHLTIGPSALHWDGNSLTIWIEEVTAPLPSRLSGVVKVTPRALTGRSFTLDALSQGGGGRHRWSPIAPVADVEVTMTQPGLSWFGTGYLDSNEGDRPLERDFHDWDWCRAPTKEGAIILYNAQRRVAGRQDLALRIDGAGAIEQFAPPPPARLPRTLWGLHPSTRCDAHSLPIVRQRLEDAPFYARSVIETRLGGERVHAVHECLVMDRFTAPWVQAMLPFRIPRAR